MVEFRQAINDVYDPGNSEYEWGLLMNPTPVKKIRTGGFLLNQQVNKSNKVDINEIEADGTFIAFRYLKMKRGTREWKEYIENGTAFGRYCEICLSNEPKGTSMNFIPKLVKTSTDDAVILRSDIPTQVDFLTFDFNVDNCLDQTNGKLLDKLFIDHTPVQMSQGTIQYLMDITFSCKNIVVLNCGSIVNSSKSWKPALMNYFDKIKTNHDIKLFQQVRAALPDKDNVKIYNNGYDDFVGSSFGKLPITYTSDQSVDTVFHNFAKAMYDAEVGLRKDKGLLTSLGYTAPNAPVNVL